MERIDWAIGGTTAVLIAGVGASLMTIVSLTWTPDLEQLTADWVGPQAERTSLRSESVEVRQAPVGVLATEPELPESGPVRVETPITPAEPTEPSKEQLMEGLHQRLEEQRQRGVAGRTDKLWAGAGGSQLGGLPGLEALGQLEGAGALGSRGIGHGGGGSGYGLGSGTVGSSSRGAGTGASRSFGASGGLSRSELGPGIASLRRQTASTSERVSGFVQADRDRLSTFAIDVDTGSYTLSRGRLHAGQLPRHEQVRVEEFVNAMDYALAPPTSGQVPFAVAAEGAPHPTEATHALLRVALKGEVPDPGDRANRLTFLVDTSCSMTDDLPLVQRSLHTLVDHAGPEDSIAIATYAGASRSVLRPTPVTQRERIHAAIDALSTGGGTAMGSGMQLAYDMADEAYVPGAENRVLVLSDGDANIGPTSHQEILDRLRHYAGEGITLSAIGFGGANYRDGLMEQLADNGDGNYVYIDGPREAERVFGEGLDATLTTIARDVKVQVAFDTDAVLAWRLIGYENRDVADEDFRDDAVDGGEIGAGHEVTALYELVLADRLPARIGHVYLRAKPPGPDQPAHEWTVPIRSAQLRSEWGDASDDLRLAAGAALFAEKLRASPFVEEVAWEDVQDLLRPLPEQRQVVELRDLVTRAQRLRTPATTPIVQASLLPSLADPSSRSMEVVRGQLHRLRYCYQRRLVVDPHLAGEVQLRLAINDAGRVVAVDRPTGSLDDAQVNVCLQSQLQALRFPKGAAHELVVDLSFAP